MSADGDAVRRRPVDAKRVEAADPGPAVMERPRGGERERHRGLLDVGRDEADLAEAGGDGGERGKAGAVDAVVVRHEDAHGVAVVHERGQLVAARGFPRWTW